MGPAVLDFDAPAVIDGEYRYSLTRIWDSSLFPMVFIMLNPLTADHRNDDPTITRCRNRALRDNTTGRLVVVNLFALRSPDPGALTRHPEPVGPGNDDWILGAATLPGAVVVAAWGAHGAAIERGAHVTRMLRDAGVSLHCLGTTKWGAPRHPLYVRALEPLKTYRHAGGTPA